MNDEVKGEGFTIRDKRFSSKGKNETKEKKENKKDTPGTASEVREKKRQDIPTMEINFSNFILSLTTSATFHFGDIEDPITKKKEKNLPLAKQTIDTIAMLKEKTKGNLTNDEETLVDHLLYELRMRYVKETR